MGEPTHLQAADELASRAGTLADIANAERHEAEYQHGYRDAHDEIVEWLRNEFEAAAQSADGPDPDDETVTRAIHHALCGCDFTNFECTRFELVALHRAARAARRALASQSPTGAGVETGDGGAA